MRVGKVPGVPTNTGPGGDDRTTGKDGDTGETSEVRYRSNKDWMNFKRDDFYGSIEVPRRGVKEVEGKVYTRIDSGRK